MFYALKMRVYVIAEPVGGRGISGRVRGLRACGRGTAGTDDLR